MRFYKTNCWIMFLAVLTVITAGIGVVEGRTGGPDYLGYTFSDSNTPGGPTYNWIDIKATGTKIEVLNNSDDHYTSNGISVGFFFNFYGTDYSLVNVTNNGIIFATAGSGDFSNVPINNSPLHNFIAPFWDDIVTWNRSGGPLGGIYYQVIGTAPNRKFIVEWENNQHYSSSPKGVTFETILNEGTNNILFQYSDVSFGEGYPGGNNGSSATVGIEGPDGNGLQYSYNEQVLSPGLAILFKFPAFSGTNMYLSKSAAASMDHGNTMNYTLYYNNFGGVIASDVVLLDTLPSNVEFVSASDGGTFDPNTRKVTWNIGSVAVFPSGRGSRTVTVRIPTSVPVGTVIQNTASISTTTLETRYDDNNASASTTVTGSNLPPDVGVSPINGNSGGTPSVYWSNPITYSYQSSTTATGVNIRIHINDGGPDITGSMTGGISSITGGIRSMTGGFSTWTYTAAPFYPRHGSATVTYTVLGESCQAATAAPDGLHISPPSGLIGLEQHLYNNTPGDGYVPPSGSFPSTGLVGSGGRSSYSLDNGYAGIGAFAPHPSNLSEKYYINMRWPDGVDWSPTQNRLSPNVTNSTTYLKYKHKKVLITAPATGKRLIASIEESGPALWTGKDAGAPPEVFVDLGLYPRGDGQSDLNNYTVNFEWADQNASLGPCTPSITFNIYIDPAGYIYDANTGARITGASVWLQRPDGSGGWENVPTLQTPAIMQPDTNPLITEADGQYQWDVLAGSYRVHVEAPGYYPADSIVVSIPPPVTDLHVGLIRIPDVPFLNSINVTPNPKTLIVGENETFTASPKDQNGYSISASVTWSSSNETVGTVDPNTGEFNALVAGTTMVNATNGSIIGTAVVTVSNIPPFLNSINVTPNPKTLIVGENETFTASPKDQNGYSISASVTWSSSNETVGTVDPNTGEFNALVAGTTMVNATNGSIIGTAVVTVSNIPPFLNSINVTPNPKTLIVGENETFTASPKDQNGYSISASVTWSSSNETVGTVDPNTGEFNALVAGTTMVNATNGSIIGTAIVTVNAISASTNLIRNPGFESGTASWLFYTNGIGSFSIISPGHTENNASKIALGSVGTNMQLYQTGITLDANTRYRLSFAAYSSTGHDMVVRLLKHGSPYTIYAPDFRPNLGTSWQTFTTEFNTTGFAGTVNDGRLMFYFAGFAAAGDTYYIDDVRLEKVVSAPVLPIIITQPANQNVMAGQTAAFSVMATGAMLSYQWQKNDTNIPGAISASYITLPTTLSDNGSTYRVIVTNLAGSAMSNAAILIVVSTPTPIPPTITVQPVNKTVITGQTATFSVIASGTAPFSYQWQKNGSDIPGATGASYTTPPATLLDNGSTYRVNVTNLAGSVMSNSATLTVLPAGSINVINNPGFESGTASWLFYTNGIGSFSIISPGYTENNASKIALGSVGTNMQLYQMGVTLDANTRYRLSFAAYSSTGHDMVVQLLKHGSPYTIYAPDFRPNLGTSWQTFTTEFNTTGFSGRVNDGRLMFFFAGFAAAGDIYYIDDVRLEKI